jgi:hypothetical protein
VEDVADRLGVFVVVVVVVVVDVVGGALLLLQAASGLMARAQTATATMVVRMRMSLLWRLVLVCCQLR